MAASVWFFSAFCTVYSGALLIFHCSSFMVSCVLFTALSAVNCVHCAIVQYVLCELYAAVHYGEVGTFACKSNHKLVNFGEIKKISINFHPTYEKFGMNLS